MMNLAKKILKSPVRILLKRNAQITLDRIRHSNNVIAASISKALKETLQDHTCCEENKWIDRIESLRCQLNKSSTNISLTDYGAEHSSGPKQNNKRKNQETVTSRTIGYISQSASKPYFWSLLLFRLIRELNPSRCLELGTCLGISGAYQASALKMNGKGRFVTLEGAAPIAALAEKHFQSLGLDNVRVVVGRFQDTLDDGLNEQQPIDFAFIDGHHDEVATLEYFKKILPFLDKKAVMIFDDITWSPGMKKAWNTIREDEEGSISIDLRSIGICILDSDMTQKYHYRTLLI